MAKFKIFKVSEAWAASSRLKYKLHNNGILKRKRTNDINIFKHVLC